MKAIARWAGSVSGLLVFALLVIIALGASLPPNHVASCTARYSTPLLAVWLALRDDPASAKWRSDINAATATRSGATTTLTETDKYGHTLRYAQTIDDSRHRIVRTMVPQQAAAFGGSWTIDLIPADHGTQVRIVEDGTIYNPVFRFLSHYFLGYTATMQRYLGDLGAHFGEHLQPRGKAQATLAPGTVLCAASS